MKYRITRVVTPADSLALVTLDQAKTALGIPLTDTSKDAQLTQRIDAVSAAVNNYCNRVFAVQAYRDQFRYAARFMRLGQPLRTRQSPIVIGTDDVPLVSVTENDVVLDPGQFEVDPPVGDLHRLDQSWSGQLILADYTAGFDPIPPDVQAGTLEWLRADWFATERGDPAVRSETAVDVASFSYFDWAGGGGSSGSGSAVPPSARTSLLPYRVFTV